MFHLNLVVVEGLGIRNPSNVVLVASKLHLSWRSINGDCSVFSNHAVLDHAACPLADERHARQMVRYNRSSFDFELSAVNKDPTVASEDLPTKAKGNSQLTSLTLNNGLNATRPKARQFSLPARRLCRSP